MHAIILHSWIYELYVIFNKVHQVQAKNKFKKFELQNYGRNLTDVYNVFHKKGDTMDTHGNIFIKS